MVVLLISLFSAACIAFALPTPAARPAPLESPLGQVTTQTARTDIQLYRAISQRVASGEDYYLAAASEQRLAGYPVLPSLAIRLPTLAWVHSLLGELGSRALLVVLAMAAALAWRKKLGDSQTEFPSSANMGALLVVFGLAAALHPSTVYSHEAWAGTLLALSLGLHAPGKAISAILCAAFALMLRELALPFVLLMGSLAFWNRRWVELGGWLVTVVVFIVGLWLHLEAHAAVVMPTDRSSPGWLTLIGIAGFTGKVKAASVLGLLPSWAIGPSAILALAGWLAWRGEVGLTGTALHLGYALFFCIFGRPDNYYWGFVSMPTLLIGFLVLPSLSKDLAACLSKTP